MILNQCIQSMAFTRHIKCISVICAMFVVGSLPLSANAFEILLGTGETGTFSHFTGRTLCRLINRHTDDINCSVVPSTGYVDNLTNVHDGSLDIALVGSRVLHDAINNTGYFEFLDIKYDNLRTLLPLYEVPVSLVVRRDAKISSLDGLKGKRINAGAPRSLQKLAMEAIMKMKGWSRKDFKLVTELPTSQSQDSLAFCHGTVQAMVHIGVHPDPALKQLLSTCKADLIGINDSDIQKLIKDHPAYTAITIAADTYPTQSQVTTVGVTIMLVTSEDIDEQTIYKIIDAIYSNQARLKSAHSALATFTDRVKARQLDAKPQIHPGAAKYFAEHGM